MSTSSPPSDEPDNSKEVIDKSLSLRTSRRNRKGHVDQVQSSSMASSQTLYIPIASPPTPAPSPGPVTHQGSPFLPLSVMNTQDSGMRRHFLSSVVSLCTPYELLFISQIVSLLLKRDFLYSLP